MPATFTYQGNDTIRVNSLLDLQQQISQPPVLQIKRIPIPLERLRIDTTRREMVVKPKPPTRAQIRYWQKQQEAKLLIGDSRYIKPRTNVQLVTEKVADNIGLPEHQLSRMPGDWITIILMFLLFVFATLKVPFTKYLKHLFASLVNYQTASRMYNEKNFSILHGAFRLEIYFYFISSLFLYQVLTFYGTRVPFANFSLFLFSFGVVITYFLLKQLLYKTIGIINKESFLTNEYIFNINNFNRVLGLVIFPVSAVIAYSPYFKSSGVMMFLGVLIVAIVYLMSLFRGMKILLKKQISIFYLFLYLCTLEFLPLLLIFKMVFE